MSTVLAYTSPALGHLFPMTPLLLELSSRGHDVHVRTMDGQLDRLRDLGLKAEPIDPRVSEVLHDDYEVVSPVEALKHAVRVFTERAPLDGADLRAAIHAVAPDLLLIDVNCWGALTAAEASGLPFVTFAPYIPPVRAAGAPPFGPGLPPAAGPLGRLRDAIVRPLVLGVAERAMRPGMNELRAAAGLGQVRGADDFFRRADLLLITTAEPFDYPGSDRGDGVVSIGACAWEPPVAPPAWLDEITDPIVLVTTSSEFQDDAQLVRCALDALADQPVAVVATMPAGVAKGLTLPANARVEEFVPHGPVLDRAALAITHGGMGATQKALSRGVPVVAVPFGRDQMEVARRVEVSGAGVRLPAKKLTTERLRAAALDAMGRTEAARRVADGYAAAGGAATGADAIERLLPAEDGQAGS